MSEPLHSTEKDVPTRWRKKPVGVEARQFLPKKHDWAESSDLAAWCGGTFYPGSPGMSVHNPWLIIPTLEGDMRAEPGDWIIRGVQGEFYPCKPDIFEATYERVLPPAVPAPARVPSEEG
jgi:hypothetical protein